MTMVGSAVEDSAYSTPAAAADPASNRARLGADSAATAPKNSGPAWSTSISARPVSRRMASAWTSTASSSPCSPSPTGRPCRAKTGYTDSAGPCLVTVPNAAAISSLAVAAATARASSSTSSAGSVRSPLVRAPRVVTAVRLSTICAAAVSISPGSSAPQSAHGRVGHAQTTAGAAAVSSLASSVSISWLLPLSIVRFLPQPRMRVLHSEYWV
jgi:hypothetical protein